jgi:bifunctional UDP-N-acetylglucosamine pyrophosphorylase/glucosamine-1-phosphate N-acetyltransferase
MTTDIHLVVLAAGKGTRMKSALPKVLHDVAGLPMIERVLRAAAPLDVRTTTIVVGHGAERVREAFDSRPGLTFALQEPQLGTAHALLQAESALAGLRGTVLLLYGDVPLLQTRTLERLVAAHRERSAAATVLTAIVGDPFGYGRIVREHGEIARIVEQRDATPAEQAIREINSGIYALELDGLFDRIRRIAADNDQQEYYLTDFVAMCRREGLTVATVTAEDENEVRGINSRAELAELGRLVRERRNGELMAAGVTLIDPAATYIDPDVTIGPDTIVHPGVAIQGRSVIGAGCVIHAGTRIVDSRIGNGVLVRDHCVIAESVVDEGAAIGPFAHLRPASEVRRGAHVGNFVELKKTVLGAGSKANHLAYIGDATVGERVNIGAGTITCNYDGTRKHPTIIEDEVFIGSDSQLIAPVRIGRGAYVAAGSSISEDVPAGALGIARGRQVNKAGWVGKRKAGC